MIAPETKWSMIRGVSLALICAGVLGLCISLMVAGKVIARLLK